ncbi:unnamed protein product [Protopolystoma xenopodis]|uniref:Uncharacterized protein n=1 Tax=Protopolystoma xenopodis TaxID=117903 RepID=A0A3S5BQV2_9PLAT|nr:unnamed protein product [Protopolystoma xenopodis]
MCSMCITSVFHNSVYTCAYPIGHPLTHLYAVPSHLPFEYAFVFTNVGGQAVVLSMPTLRRRDLIPLLDSSDVVAVASVLLAEPGSCGNLSPQHDSTIADRIVLAPGLGFYQLAPGQKWFDIVSET